MEIFRIELEGIWQIGILEAQKRNRGQNTTGS